MPLMTDRSKACWLPGLRTVRSYRVSWFRHDLTAGLVITALLVPAGMGYAEAAGLPAVTGLYATIVPLLVYAVVGPSRILVFGPDSSLAPLIAATVIPLAGADVGRVMALAAALSLLAGAITVIAGLARFGYLTDLLSLPVRYGYMNGIALLIFVSQSAKLCDLPGRSEGLIDGVRDLVDGLRTGEANRTSIVLGGGALALIVVLRRWAPRVPGALVAVVAAIVIVNLFDLADHGLSLVGELPAGLPRFDVPEVRRSDLSTLLAGAAGIAVVSMADTSALSRTMAMRERSAVDSNQELMATGVVNIATGFFQGFPVSASASRTPVAAASGARTQLTGVVGAAAAGRAGLGTRSVPRPSVVGASGRRHRGGDDLRRGTPAGPFGDGASRGVGHQPRGPSRRGCGRVIPGIGIAVGVSLMAFIRRAWSPHTAELVRVDGLKGYHDVRRHPEGRRIPGLALLRFDAPLFFANADTFKREVLRLARDPDRRVRWIVVTAEPVTDVDVTAAHALSEVLDELDELGIVLAFAEMKGGVRERLDAAGLGERIGVEHFYRTIGQAVKASVTATGSAWTGGPRPRSIMSTGQIGTTGRAGPRHEDFAGRIETRSTAIRRLRCPPATRNAERQGVQPGCQPGTVAATARVAALPTPEGLEHRWGAGVQLRFREEAAEVVVGMDQRQEKGDRRPSALAALRRQ